MDLACDVLNIAHHRVFVATDLSSGAFFVFQDSQDYRVVVVVCLPNEQTSSLHDSWADTEQSPDRHEGPVTPGSGTAVSSFLASLIRRLINLKI